MTFAGNLDKKLFDQFITHLAMWQRSLVSALIIGSEHFFGFQTLLWSRGYKTFFMLSSAELKISNPP